MLDTNLIRIFYFIVFKFSLINIPNLLWFCNHCLPNINNAFSSHGTVIPPDSQNHTNQSPEQNTHAQRQTDVSISSVSTNPTVLVQQDESIQMAIDDTTTNSTGNVEPNASKKRRISIDGDDNAVECQIPIIPAAPRRTSTNYRCIYLSPYPPSTIESAVTTYAVSEKNRDATEIMECKRLLPAKCNMNKVTYVSFKLTVHAEFFDVYMNLSFWPDSVKAAEFETRPPKKRQHFQKFRVNPFAVQRPSQIQQHRNPPAPMMRILPSGLDSHTPFNGHRSNRTHRNNNNHNANANSNSRSNANHRGSLPHRKNHQRQFTHQTSRRFPQQNTWQNNKNSHQNRGRRTMDPEQLMTLFEQFSLQMKSLLNQR